MATFKENLLLSKLAYNNFDKKNEIGKSIGELLDNKVSTLAKFVKDNPDFKKPLESMSDWKIINYQPNKSTGYAGVAFLSPEGEIVIACRGTEPGLSLDFARDLVADAKIATAFDIKMNQQFNDAEKFFCQTLGIKSPEQLLPGTKVSFTGHSLGGGVAQYLAYRTRDKGTEATTFNAVGIGQCFNAKLGMCHHIKNYCDAWDIIGNYGVHLGERIYIHNDQRLDGPVYPGTHSMMDYAINPLRILEDHWNSAIYTFNRGVESIRDEFRKNLNSYMLGTLYSHDLSFFLNDYQPNGQFNELHRAEKSEVEIAQIVSRFVNMEMSGAKKIDAMADQIITQFVEQKTPKAKTVDKTQPKPGPKDSFIWPKWSTSEQAPRDFLAVSAQMKQSNLAKELGYSSYNLLINNSKLCGEKSGVKFYSTEHPETGKVVLWDNRNYKPLLEFADRKALESAPVQEHVKQHLNQTPAKVVASEKRGMVR